MQNLTNEEKKQLVDAVITQLKNDGTDVSNANIVSNEDGIDYVVAYDKNGQIVRAVPTAIKGDKIGVTGDMNTYTEGGVYSINATGGNNLPINNQGIISARLIVLVTEGGGNKVITQVLNLNNNEGGEGNIYIRAWQNGEWKAWGKLQTNIEVGQVNTLDHFTDNGMYSGVLTNGTPTSVGTFYDTFLLIVINNYAVSIPTGNPQSISQLKYSLGLDGSISVATRKRDQYGYWTEWESIEGGGSAVDANSLDFEFDEKSVHLIFHDIGENNNTPYDVLLPTASTIGAGVMSAADKKKLDSLSPGGGGGGVAELMEEVTYSELVALRDNASLVAGMKYRITDYVTTTVQQDTKSANHPFDVIVEAVSENELSELARAIQRDGDTYFDGNDLGAWQLWYDLDNNTDKYNWADAKNGKGVIYRMIDEKKNDCPYDFKNMLFLHTNFTIGTTSDRYHYTFSYVVSNVLYDGTIEKRVTNCHDNSIGVYTGNNGKSALNRNIFRNTSFGSNCHSNTFSFGCYFNTFGTGCFGNTFDYNCYYNKFGNFCYHNIFGRNCYNNNFGNRCFDNTFSANCIYKKFEENTQNGNFGAGSTSIIYNEEYYDDGTNALVPIKHPDLSTQPSILPYKFMGQYVYEQLIPLYDEPTPSGYGFNKNDLAVPTPLFIDAKIISLSGRYIYDSAWIREGSDYGYDYLIHSYKHEGGYMTVTDGYAKIVYTSMPKEEEEGDYYGYNNY